MVGYGVTVRSTIALSLVCAAALAQQPRIDSVTPSQGPIAGGTAVTIKGANFTGATLSLDRNSIAPASQSDTEIRLTMPAHDNGFAVIALRNGSAVGYSEFLYVPPRLEDLPAGFITTIAGMGTFSRDYGNAKEASISPYTVSVDPSGAIYIASAGVNEIQRVRNGIIERFAGIGTGGTNLGDGGPAIDAFFQYARCVAIDPEGNVYIPDAKGRIRKVDSAGVITTIAGDGTRGYSGDGGPAKLARIGQPTYMAADADDIFFIDFDNSRIRRIHRADGIISTFGGTGTAGFSGDGGPATDAQFNVGVDDRGFMTLGPNGDVFFVDARNRRIRKIDRRTGIITTVVTLPPGNGEAGTGGVTFDSTGNLYYSIDGKIVELDPSLHQIASWGSGTTGFSEDGTLASGASFGVIQSVAVEADGSIVYPENSVQSVRRINRATGRIETIAGIGPHAIGETGPAIATVFSILAGINFTPAGDLLIADQGNARVRVINRSGNISTIAGDGTIFGPVDGAIATKTGIVPLGVAARADGGYDLPIWMWVWEITADGKLRKTVGKLPGCALSGDGGPAQNAGVCQPFDTVRDRDGNLFLADTNNNRVRRVDAKTGVITTVAGDSGPTNGLELYGHGTFCGDGGPARESCLNTPLGLAFDGNGNLFVSEAYANRIRKIDPSGTITSFASKIGVTKMTTDSAGNLFGVGSRGLLRMDPAGNATAITATTAGFSGDGGPASQAQINAAIGSPGIAIDREGNLFFVDELNRRIRAVRYGAVLAPTGATIRASNSKTTITTTVLDSSGHAAGGVRIELEVPKSGASCALSSGFAITDATGMATVTCTPNCTTGSYTVTARPLGSNASANVAFTNVEGPCRRHTVRH